MILWHFSSLTCLQEPSAQLSSDGIDKLYQTNYLLLVLHSRQAGFHKGTSCGQSEAEVEMFWKLLSEGQVAKPWLSLSVASSLFG